MTQLQFESAVLECSDAAYNLARWLVRDEQDARDVVQDACVRAFRGRDGYRGEGFRTWFLTIVRNASFNWLRKHRRHDAVDSAEDIAFVAADCETYDPQAIALRAGDVELVRGAIDRLPAVLREAIVLREMEGLSYREIGRATGAPMGTVMSRLARGRAQLAALLTDVHSERKPR